MVEKEKKKGFLAKLLDKLDKKLAEQSKSACCCSSKKKEQGQDTCSDA